MTFTYKYIIFIKAGARLTREISLERDYANKPEMFVYHTCYLAHPEWLVAEGTQE